MKIITLFGTRPEIIKLSSIIKYIDSFKFVNQFLVNTMQNFDTNLNSIFFQDLNLRMPDFQMKNLKYKSHAGFLSESFLFLESVINKTKPDAAIVLGDTNSGLSSMLFKKYTIPIYHIEAGNRSFDENVPEETNRKIIDHISDYNLVYTERSRLNLIKENIMPHYIYKIGSPLYEVINQNITKIDNSIILKKFSLEKESYIVLSIHREENVTNKTNIDNISNIIFFLLKKYPLKKIILSLHPRFKNIFNKLKIKHKNLIVNRPFNFSDYMHLQKNSFCVISDSGTITEESSMLGFYGLSLRNSFERHEGLESGSILNTGLEINGFRACLLLLIENKSKKSLKIVPDYTSPNCSEIVFNLISSTHKTNKYWKNLIKKNF